MPKISLSLEQRLLINRRISKSKFYNNTPCWEWTGTLRHNPQGIPRGQIVINYKKIQTHRLAAKLWLKDYKEELQTHHYCDNTICFNPEHLWQGTQRENVLDAIAKGRHNLSKGKPSIQGNKQFKEFIKGFAS